MLESGGKKAGYAIALERAWDELVIDNLPASTEISSHSDDSISLIYFGRKYHIDLANRSIRTENGSESPEIRKILILHYLLGATHARIRNHEVGFAQIPGAEGYLRPFSGRVIFPLTGMFDREPKKTATAFATMGAEMLDFATWCCKVWAFALVPLRIIYWRGDDEIASGGQIVFDAGIGEIFAVEDVAVLCEDMMRLLRE